MSKRNRLEITSASQALSESYKLPAVWSDETRLTQRLLVYIASLLEQLVRQRKPRKATPWQVFLGKALKSGKTIQEAGAEWKARKKSA